MKNEKKNFWDNFNESLLSKITKFRNGETKPMNYRGNIDLDKACKKMLENYKHENLTMTDVIEAGKTQFAFGNTLTARGAVMIIAKKNSVVARAAQVALDDESQFPDFIDHIKEQCTQGNRTTLIKNHGSDVIEAILNYK